MPEKNRLAFGKIPAYRRFELFMERYRSAVDDFILPHIEWATKESPALVLDVGCGEGYLHYFCDPDRMRFHGVEFQPDRIEKCKKLGYKIWSFNIEKEPFPFADNSYDVLVASHVIEHLYQPERALQEIYRILKPGGLAVIGVPMHPHWATHLMYLKERFFPNPPLGHHQFYSMRTLPELLSDFELIDIRGFRLISARKKFSWEDSERFYQLSTWWGRRFPHLTPEVNAIIRKPKESGPTQYTKESQKPHSLER